MSETFYQLIAGGNPKPGYPLDIVVSKKIFRTADVQEYHKNNFKALALEVLKDDGEFQLLVQPLEVAEDACAHESAVEVNPGEWHCPECAENFDHKPKPWEAAV